MDVFRSWKRAVWPSACFLFWDIIRYLSRHFRVPKKESIDCTTYQMIHPADIKRYILQSIKRQHQDILDTIKRICCNVSPLAIDSNLLTDDRHQKTFVRSRTTSAQIRHKKASHLFCKIHIGNILFIWVGFGCGQLPFFTFPHGRGDVLCKRCVQYSPPIK